MRKVDVDREVDILVGSSDENLDIFEEAPCWWLGTRGGVFSSRFFRGESRVLFMIARVSGHYDACYCFRSRCLEMSWNVVVNCRKIFSSTKI